MTTYHRRTYLVAPEDEEALGAELVARGSLGCEVREADGGRLRLVAYFPDPLPPAFEAWQAPGGLTEEEAEVFEDQDWLAGYRAAARPVPLGSSFLVDVGDGEPALLDQDGASGRRVLRIPARTAFGTGSHESTRLAALWLEEIDVHGAEVLDVGTGSGILAFVALHLGARRVVGFDLDAQAVLVARTNCGLNALQPALFAGRLEALGGNARFDLALVNVLPERILGEVPRLVTHLRRGGRLISSGNLRSRRGELLKRFASFGLRSAGEKTDGDWIAFLLERIR